MKNLQKGLAAVLTGLLILSGCSSTDKKTTLKKHTFEIEVKKKVKKDPEQYFNGDTKDLKIDWSHLNNKKLGSYKISAKQDKKKFTFTIVVVDKTAPKIKATQKEFVFKLGEVTVEQVKSEVLNNIKVTDNYDKEIDLTKLFDNFAIPTEEKLIKFPITVEDSSGNKSKITLKLQFTKSGEKKENIKEETIPNQVASNVVASNQPSKKPSKPNSNGTGGNEKPNNGNSSGSTDKPSTGGGNTGGADKPSTGGGNTGGTDKPNTGGGNTGGGSTDVPSLPPVTPSEPDKVKTTCANLQPAPHPLGNTGLCFNTYEEAEAWCTEQDINESAQWHGYYFVLGNVSNYPTPLPGEPWSVWAYKI